MNGSKQSKDNVSCEEGHPKIYSFIFALLLFCSLWGGGGGEKNGLGKENVFSF